MLVDLHAYLQKNYSAAFFVEWFLLIKYRCESIGGIKMDTFVNSPAILFVLCFIFLLVAGRKHHFTYRP